MDTVSKEVRSRNMAAIKGKDTKPETSVRKLLHSLGYRFRLHRKDLPGKPDIVLPKYKTVVFVHGCFSHQHKGCKYNTQPKSNKQFWLPKLRKNVERDKKQCAALKKLGYKVLTIWECDVKKATKDNFALYRRIRNI
jgi:DNA mismatch endonuclease (patch repair protein)